MKTAEGTKGIYRRLAQDLDPMNLTVQNRGLDQGPKKSKLADAVGSFDRRCSCLSAFRHLSKEGRQSVAVSILSGCKRLI